MNPNAAQIAEVADNLAKVQSFDPWSAKWISEAHMLLRGLAAPAPVAEVVAAVEPAQPVEAVDETIEAVIACLGDDAATLRGRNPEDEMAANMDEAARLLAALAHPRPTGDLPVVDIVEQPNGEHQVRVTRDDMVFYAGNPFEDIEQADFFAECVRLVIGLPDSEAPAPTGEQAGEVVGAVKETIGGWGTALLTETGKSLPDGTKLYATPLPPAGFRVVPVEPQGCDPRAKTSYRYGYDHGWKACREAMLAAAPEVPRD
jgi:hypothetical protein